MNAWPPIPNELALATLPGCLQLGLGVQLCLLLLHAAEHMRVTTLLAQLHLVAMLSRNGTQGMDAV